MSQRGRLHIQETTGRRITNDPHRSTEDLTAHHGNSQRDAAQAVPCAT